MFTYVVWSCKRINLADILMDFLRLKYNFFIDLVVKKLRCNNKKLRKTKKKTVKFRLWRNIV